MIIVLNLYFSMKKITNKDRKVVRLTLYRLFQYGCILNHIPIIIEYVNLNDEIKSFVFVVSMNCDSSLLETGMSVINFWKMV